MTALRFKKVSVLLFLCAVFCGLSLFAVNLPVFAQKKTMPKKGSMGCESGSKPLGTLTNLVEKAIERARDKMQDFSAKPGANTMEKVLEAILAANKSLDRIKQLCEKGGKGLDSITEGQELSAKLKQLDADWNEQLKNSEDALVQAFSSVTAPKEIYTGADKEKFRKMIKDGWQKAWPNDEILAIRFHENQWEHRKSKQWNDTVNEWMYNDITELSTAVVVKITGKIAAVYPAYVSKDNLKGGEVSVGVHTKAGYVVKYLPVANVK